ncbi:hydantoinase/oxoprolinase family protein [Rhizobiaceae bacterium]|nr:hydantoinase/oxoprolinase family protein [Rhizobiaceae bacterium]
MTYLLGIDTGGTYTDAALMDASGDLPVLVAKAKSLTTRHDLSLGIDAAIGAVLEGRDPGAIGLVSLSTTLATNALVEGHGARVTLVAIGFAPRDLERAGLAEAMGTDPVVMVEGGHTTHGQRATPLDLAALDAANFSGVSAVAVAGLFATRNPAHELAAKQAIATRTGLPVTCSHELSARLNGPKRALTTVLNARLVPMIDGLLTAMDRVLSARKIGAPVMVVRGDGALVSAAFARHRPIETILSGPAASLVGARFLTGLDDAVVNDIGGTTSDVAVLSGGLPVLDPDGARVGGHRTMVEAVAMSTYGLGGDSAVGLSEGGLTATLTLGPGRVVPLALAAKDHGPAIHKALDARLRSAPPTRSDARFAMRVENDQARPSTMDGPLLARIGPTPVPLDDLLQGNAERAGLQRLVAGGVVQLIGITPTDAQHALGTHIEPGWDATASTKALTLLAGRRSGNGKALANNAAELARAIVSAVERRSAEIVLETAFATDGAPADTAATPLMQGVLDGQGGGLVQVNATLTVPLIGLGASAHLYHPPAAARLGTRAIVPEDAGVANAIGAVVGQVSQRVTRTVSQPVEGRFVVSGGVPPFGNEDEALDAAEAIVREEAIALAQASGAAELTVSCTRDIRRAEVETRPMLVEATLTATATGRPALAS